MNDRPSFLDFRNDRGTIVPPMKNKVGDSYAETRVELEARKRAADEEERRKIMERQIEAMRMQMEADYKRKRSGLIAWGIIMTVLFLIGGAGTAYFYIFYQKSDEKVSTQASEIIKLTNEKSDLEKKLTNDTEILETFEEYYGVELNTKKDIPAEVWAGIKLKQEEKAKLEEKIEKETEPETKESSAE